MSKIVAGVVGLGVGEQHAQFYDAYDKSQLKWVFDTNKEKSSQYNGKAANSYNEILDDPDVNIVSIASYDDIHTEQILAALNSGKHVFVEKPLCRTKEELLSIKQTWENNNKPVLLSNLVLRAAPLYQWLKKSITVRDLGSIYSIDGDYLYGRLHKITEGWRKNVTDYSVITGGGVHLIDLMIWLTGEKPTHVTVTGNNICTKNSDFKYKDFGAATFEFDSTMIGRVTANFGAVHKHQHLFRIFGDKASVIYDDKGPRITREREAESESIEHSPIPDSKADLIPDVINAIVNPEASMLSTQHEFDVISACIAADNSLKTGQRTKIEYV